MLLASCGSEIKFHRWPSGDYHGSFQIPETGFYIPSISWCNEGELLATTAPSLGPPIIISVGKTIQTHQVIDLLQVQALTFSRTIQKNIMLGTEEGHVLLYDLNKHGIIQQLPTLPTGVKYLQYGALDTFLAAGCRNGQICLYNSKNTVCATFCVPNSHSLTAMSYHTKQPHILAAASGDGIVVVWDSSTGDTKIVEKHHTASITDLSFSLGDDMVTVGLDQKFNGYDLRTKECIFTCMADSQLSAVGFMPTGEKIAVASVDGKLYCYDKRRIAYPIHTIVAHHPKAIGRIAFQPLPYLEELASHKDSLGETQNNSNLSNGETVVFNSPRNCPYSTILESTRSACHIQSTILTISADSASDSPCPASGDGCPHRENQQLNAILPVRVESTSGMPTGLEYFNTAATGKSTSNTHPAQTDTTTISEHVTIGRYPGVPNFLTAPENSNKNRIAAGLDTVNGFDPAKKDAIASWIKKLPTTPPPGNVTIVVDSESEVVQVGKELVDVTKDTVERLTDMINKEFMRIRMALSRGFIRMEYKMNARWQEFNSALMQFAGYELSQRDGTTDDINDERNDAEDIQAPSRIPKRNFHQKEN